MTKGGNGERPPGAEGLELQARGRESTLERLKKSLAEREVPVPRIEGYPFRKAAKILELAGVHPQRLRLRLQESVEARGQVIRQYPAAGDPVDLDDDGRPVELTVADTSNVVYLPQLYQRSDFTGRNFIRNFLWIMQHLQFETDEKLQNLERFFDAFECPPAFVDYLASWVALELQEEWPDVKRRSLIKKAVELYHLRGTPRGLRVYLRLFTGVDPVIHENVWPHPGLVVGITSTVGVDTVLVHEVQTAHTFVIHIPLPIDEMDEETILRIHQIVEREKPVHTDYYLTFAEPEEVELDSSFVVGVSSTIGVDTWVRGDAEDYYVLTSGEGGLYSSEGPLASGEGGMLPADPGEPSGSGEDERP